MDAVTLTLIRVSQMVIDLAEVIEMDINPIWVNASGPLALDANIRIEPATAPRRSDWRFRPIQSRWSANTGCLMDVVSCCGPSCPRTSRS